MHRRAAGGLLYAVAGTAAIRCFAGGAGGSSVINSTSLGLSIGFIIVGSPRKRSDRSGEPQGDVEYIALWNAIREVVSVTIVQGMITFAQYKKLNGP